MVLEPGAGLELWTGAADLEPGYLAASLESGATVASLALRQSGSLCPQELTKAHAGHTGAGMAVK